MPPVAAADSLPLETSKPHEFTSDTSVTMDSNHDLPARTGRDTDKHEQIQSAKEDPATTAASEELRHTSLSDKAPSDTPAIGSEEEKITIDTTTTPEAERTDAQDEEMRERISSPKKKRGRDQDEEAKEVDDENGDDPTSSADGSVVNGSRSTRSEPEKKRRPRDTSEDFSKSAAKEGEMKVDSISPAKTNEKNNEVEKSESRKSPSPSMSKESVKAQTSASAFASSGFASLAASSSPFGTLGATKPSVFGGNAQGASSGFGGLAAGSASSTSTSTTTSGFGALGGKPASGFSFGSGTSSGFGGLGTGSVFGSKLGNGFAGGSGPKLSSFAAPGTDPVIVGSKPAKAFGAPESDEDGATDDDESDGGAASDDEENVATVLEEKKKSKISKVQIDDGEAGEATLLQLRAKLFALESKEVGWKERGVGTLKINVPKSCASYDPYGAPIPGSFDASGIEEEEGVPLVVRLVMRQENTHRVVLNTVILSGMEFQEKPAASTAQFLFTAFEGEKEPRPVNMLLKMSEANARMFRSEIDSIQRELSS